MSQGCRSSIFSLFYCPHFGIFGTVIDDCIFTMKWLCSNYHHHYSRGVSIHFPNVNMIKINSKHSDHVNQNICKMANIINRNNNGKQWHRGWETSDLNCLSFWLLSSSSFQFKKILFFLISLIPISIPKAKHFVLMSIFFIYKTTIEREHEKPMKKIYKRKIRSMISKPDWIIIQCGMNIFFLVIKTIPAANFIHTAVIQYIP